MKALVGAFNQEIEKALVGAFSVIVKTSCGTNGALHSTAPDSLPAAPRQVEYDGELLLAEEAAAVLQTDPEVVVVNEHELHPEVEPQPRLGRVEGLGQPDEGTRGHPRSLEAPLRSPVEQQRPLRGLHHHEQPSIRLCQRQPRHGADWAEMGKWENNGQTTFILRLEKEMYLFCH